jgi:hypothetical protein
MKMHILSRDVEGDEHGLYYLEAMGSEADNLFEEAKFKHRASFKDSEGRHYILTRESAGHYLVAHNDHD